jgi:hypothetical protein
MTNRCVHLDRRGKHFNFECSLQKNKTFSIKMKLKQQKKFDYFKSKTL